MKRRFGFIVMTVAGLLLTSQAGAQSAEDILRFSQFNYGFGTARSAAMGGAFSSLGADLSVMSINPAGLGMYRRSEIGFSPSVMISHVKTTNNDDGNRFNNSMNQTRFSLNNVGGAFNVYNGSGAMTSVTVGFAYNKMVDLNNRSNVFGRSGNTILDKWGWELANKGVLPPRDPDQMLNVNNFDFEQWGAVNAYNSRMIRYDWETNMYNTDNLFDGNTVFESDYLRYNKGSVGQYDISVGFNILNVFYFGLGFGLQDLEYTQDYVYSEYATNNGSNDLDQLHYNTLLRLSGSAWNFKLGAIIRPIPELRIGLAFHTPTYIDIQDDYLTRTDAYYHGYQPEWAQIRPEYIDEYDMRTPARFIGGASYTFFDRAILSIDYERVWYNNMKVFRQGKEQEGITTKAENWYRPTNNIRAGLEILLTPNFFGRAGYAFYDSYYKDSILQDYSKVSNYSAGLGYRTAAWGIDLAYIYMDSKDAPDHAYSYNDLRSGEFTADKIKHNITATLSFRF